MRGPLIIAIAVALLAAGYFLAPRGPDAGAPGPLPIRGRLRFAQEELSVKLGARRTELPGGVPGVRVEAALENRGKESLVAVLPPPHLMIAKVLRLKGGATLGGSEFAARVERAGYLPVNLDPGEKRTVHADVALAALDASGVSALALELRLPLYNGYILEHGEAAPATSTASLPAIATEAVKIEF